MAGVSARSTQHVERWNVIRRAATVGSTDGGNALWSGFDAPHPMLFSFAGELNTVVAGRPLEVRAVGVGKSAFKPERVSHSTT